MRLLILKCNDHSAITLDTILDPVVDLVNWHYICYHNYHGIFLLYIYPKFYQVDAILLHAILKI
jgi:hypothetical protein